MEKKVYFKGWLLPVLLITPQLLITIIFFFYPAGIAIWWSLFNPDPFGLSTKYVGLANFEFLFSDYSFSVIFEQGVEYAWHIKSTLTGKSVLLQMELENSIA